MKLLKYLKDMRDCCSLILHFSNISQELMRPGVEGKNPREGGYHSVIQQTLCTIVFQEKK